jgi:hypothetical protein
MELADIKIRVISIGKDFLAIFSPVVAELFTGLLTLKLSIYLVRGLGNEVLDHYDLSKIEILKEEILQTIHMVRTMSKKIEEGAKILRQSKIDIREFKSQDTSSAAYASIRNFTKFFNKIFMEMEIMLNGLSNNINVHEKVTTGASYIGSANFNKSQLIALQRSLEKNIAEGFANLKKGNSILKDLRIQMENI